MLSCISVGISKYKCKEWNPIECAGDDANAVYGAFEEIMGEEFLDTQSICLTEITAEEFQTVLEVVAASVSSKYERHKLIVYFSGHGNMNGGKLELLFPSYDGDYGKRGHKEDAFSVEDFAKIFEHENLSVLLILDCCYSGEALKVASCDINNTEISVLTATDGAKEARFDSDGSRFSKALCKGVREIAMSGESFTLNGLVDRMHSNGYEDLCVNRGAANEVDLVFRKSVLDHEDEKHVPALFVGKIYESSALEREALWYSLGSFPENAVYETCRIYFGQDEKSEKNRTPEASWLVRRAIGSTLAMKANYRPIRDLLVTLLESAYWQEQCIALIGLRYLVKTDASISKKVVELVNKSVIRKVDAVWLASLYLADNKNIKWTIFQGTCLDQTEWGMIEICKAFSLFKESGTLFSLEKNDFSEEVKKEGSRLNGEADTDLERYIYSGKQRGRLPKNTQAKFLLSALYGNWRNQVIINLKPYFDSKPKREIMNELEIFGEIANAERKMALFAYLEKNPNYANKYYEAVEWGLNDRHPWVRRDAVMLFRKINKCGEQVMKSMFTIEPDPNYPGLLDFYLACPPEMWDELMEYLERKEILPPGDMESLELAHRCG